MRFRKFLIPIAAAAVLMAGSVSAHTYQNKFCPVKGRIAIVDFEAEWCQPCKMMKPAWKNVEKDYKGKISVVHIDIDKEAALSQALQISAVPTQILFDRQCRVLDMHSGYLPEEDLRATFDHVLKNY